MALPIAILASCSKEASPVVVEPLPNPTTALESMQYSSFLGSVDSLNLSYGYVEPQFRGFWDWAKNNAIETIADNVGGAVGRWVGRRAGATVGAAAGTAIANPVVAVGGYYVGGKVGEKLGGLAGYAAASYAASLAIQSVKSGSVSVGGVGVSSDGISYPLSPEETSDVGAVHNALIDAVRGNEQKYISSDGTIHVELIYEDMLKAEKQLGVTSDELSSDAGYKQEMIAYCSSAVEVAKANAHKADANSAYLAELVSVSQVNHQVPVQHMNQSMELVRKVSMVASKLEGAKLDEYEKEFRRVVEASSLSPSNKVTAEVIGSIAISSTDYWKK